MSNIDQVRCFIRFVGTSPLCKVTFKKDHSWPEEYCVLSLEGFHVVSMTWSTCSTVNFVFLIMCGHISSDDVSMVFGLWNNVGF